MGLSIMPLLNHPIKNCPAVLFSEVSEHGGNYCSIFHILYVITIMDESFANESSYVLSWEIFPSEVLSLCIIYCSQ